MQQEKTIEEIIENKVKELAKLSTAPDKETPDWMEADIRRGIKAGIEIGRSAQIESEKKKDEEIADLKRQLEKYETSRYDNDEELDDIISNL